MNKWKRCDVYTHTHTHTHTRIDMHTHIHNGILFIHKKERNFAIWNIDGPGGYNGKWNKLDWAR